MKLNKVQNVYYFIKAQKSFLLILTTVYFTHSSIILVVP